MSTTQEAGGSLLRGNAADPPTRYRHGRRWLFGTRILLILTGAATTVGSIVFGEGKLGVASLSGIAAGLILLAVAALLGGAKPWMRTAATVVVGFRLIFNGYKVFVVGEASSLVFVILFIALLTLLNVPTARRFFAHADSATQPAHL